MASKIIELVNCIAVIDADELEEAEKNYGDSWKRRGGVGAFMMLARKWDRLELQVEKHHYDVFRAIDVDGREEGVLDDIRDLRRYLMLVEAEMDLRTKTSSQKECFEEPLGEGYVNQDR